MTISTESRRSSPAQRHLSVMDALSRCIKRRGLRKTRMEDIAHQAGISRISLYRDYGNREHLINSFLAYRSRQFHDRVGVEVAACTSIGEALECYLINAAELAAKDITIRELVDIHHVFQSALNDDSSPIKRDIQEVWTSLLQTLSPENAHILTVSSNELVDWILMMESSLILVVVESGWDRQRLRSMIRNFITPAFVTRL